MASRTLLMIPGPVEVDPEVLEAMARPPLSHMSTAFAALMQESLIGLQEVFDAPDGQPFLVPGSGTLAMEMALANLVEPGDRVVVVDTGYFAARMAEIAEWLDAEVIRVTAEPGALPDEGELEAALRQGVKVLPLTHVDTSTGVVVPVERWAPLAHRYGALVVVDGVCAVGGQRFHQTAWEVDVALTGSQKALAVPPGLAIVVARPSALEAYRCRRTRPRSYYADWGKWLPVMEAFQAGRPAYFATPAVNLVAALAVSLRRIRAEGLEARWARHERIARAFRAGLRAMELEMVPRDPAWAAVTLSVIYYPDGVDDHLIREIEQAGVTVAGAIHPALRGRSFRVGHMGEIGLPALLQTLSAIEIALRCLGHALPPRRRRCRRSGRMDARSVKQNGAVGSPPRCFLSDSPKHSQEAFHQEPMKVSGLRLNTTWDPGAISL